MFASIIAGAMGFSQNHPSPSTTPVFGGKLSCWKPYFQLVEGQVFKSPLFLRWAPHSHSLWQWLSGLFLASKMRKSNISPSASFYNKHSTEFTCDILKYGIRFVCFVFQFRILGCWQADLNFRSPSLTFKMLKLQVWIPTSANVIFINDLLIANLNSGLPWFHGEFIQIWVLVPDFQFSSLANPTKQQQ